MKAVIRRLQAALVPSNFPPPERPPDIAVLDEITAILMSEGISNLLAENPDDPFATVIRKAQKTIEDGGPERGIIDRLAAFLDSAKLNSAVASDDPDEQPE